MANILIKQGREIAGSNLVTPSTTADKTDLSSIAQTGTVSTQVISYGTYFYLNDVLVRARVDIANGATFTLNTNYEVVTAGALNELAGKISTINTTILGKIVKRANVNITTTSDGYATVNKSTYPHIVSVCPMDQAAVSFVYQANASKWVIFIKNAGTFAPVASTQVNVDIFYTD